MYLKCRRPLDRQTTTETGNVNDIVNKAEYKRFRDALQLRLLRLCTEGTNYPGANETRQQHEQRDERL